MEAIAGLSLAANILQVIDFSAKLLSKGREIQQAGSTIQNSELETIATDFAALSGKLRSWARPDPTKLGPLAHENQALEDLVVKSENIAQEVLSALQSLSHKKDGTKYKSWVHAFHTIWSASKIREIQTRLQIIRDELQFRILVSVREENIHGLDEASRKVLEDIVNSNRTLKADIHTQAHNILAYQEAEGALAADRHQEVLDVILSRNLEAPSVDTILQILQSKLYSHRQDDRFEDIAQAHQKTFTWALEKKNAAQSRPDLLNWLQNLSGTYWISGKAGSGKSTLMKYMVQNPRFKQALQEWAGDDNLVIATFYFWRPGAPIQRTQTGLLQSLLRQVLEQQPTMGSLLFPEQFVYGAVWTDFPTFHQLRRAFNRFANHITNSAMVSTKVAFIVDGLDEFEKDVIDFTGLADIFLTSSKSSNVKALVSSRPLPAFESCFENMPKLRLHDLTHGDITAYVETELGSRLRSTNSSTQRSSNNTDSLLTEIVDAAAGVFLWVKLVVRSLIEGVENGDTVEDLRTRLKALPRDLEDLFDYMIGSIPDCYKKQSSQIFQLLHVCRTGRIDRSLTAIEIPFALDWNEASVLQAPIAIVPLSEIEKSEDDIDRRLKSRCVGLLELRTRTVNSPKAIRFDEAVLEEETYKDIAYLHRTVADYLSRPGIWRKVLSWTAGNEFNASRTLLQSVIMKMKTTEAFPEDKLNGHGNGPQTPWPTVQDAMILARCAEDTGSAPISALLRELNRTVNLLFAEYQGSGYIWHRSFEEFRTHGYDVWVSPEPTQNGFLSLMVRYGLYHSVADVLSKHPQALLSRNKTPLLRCVCALSRGLCDVMYPRMVQLLLENGADPNEAYGNLSPWQHALQIARSFDHNFDPDKYSVPYKIDRTADDYQNAPFNWISALTLFVEHGANPNACIDGKYRRQSALRVVKAQCGSSLQGRVDHQPWTLAAMYLESQGIEVPDHIDDESLTRMLSSGQREDLEQLTNMGLNLINLLESKGAKDQVWRNRSERDVEIGSSRDVELGSSRDVELGRSRDVELGRSRDVKLGRSRDRCFGMFAKLRN